MNGVPLRRVPQSYVIATQTKVDVDSASIPKDLGDSFFKRQKKEKKRGDEMFEQTQEVSLTRVFITQSSHDTTRENSQQDRRKWWLIVKMGSSVRSHWIFSL